MRYLPLTCAILAAVSTNSYAQDLLFTKVIEKSQQSIASACVLSNGKFDDQKLDYNKIHLYENQKLAPIALAISNDQLCFTNLKHGAKYKLVLQQGLKDSNGLNLAKDTSFNFDIADANPLIEKVNGLILPKIESKALVNINSINVDKLYVTIYKYGLNNLDNTLYNYDNLYDYSLNSNYNSDLIEVAKQTIDLKVTKNSYQQTAIDFKPYLDDKTQVFIVKVSNLEDSDDPNYISTIFPIAISDLAPTTYVADESIAVSVRSITNAKPLANVKVDLIGQNNDVLESVSTDNAGFARFKGVYAKKPRAIVCRYKNDSIVQNINYSLELVGTYGQSLADMQVYTYTDRDIYRPNETIYVNSVVRDSKLEALNPKSLSVKLIMPNGKVYDKLSLQDFKYGMASYQFNLNKNAPRGNYLINVSQDGINTLSSSSISVADFIPASIKIEDSSNSSSINLTQDQNIKLFANFLYGAKASNLPYEATLQLKDNYKKITGYEDYSFGIYNKKDSFYQSYQGNSNKDGSINLDFYLENVSTPSILSLNAKVIDTQNQAVAFNKNYVIKTNNYYLGAKKLNTDNFAFDLAYINDDGNSQDNNFSYTINKVNTVYQFVYNYNRWDYRPITSKSFVTKQNVQVSDKNDKEIDLKLNNGEYELIVYDNNNNIVFANTFYQGYNSFDSNSPSFVELLADKELYKDGDKASFSFESKTNGYASVALCTDKVISYKNIEVKKGQNSFSFDIDEQSYPNAYVLMSLISPYKDMPTPLVRQVGIAKVNHDLKDKELILSTNLANEDVLKPNSKVELTINTNSNLNGIASLSLVDEGILSLTSYKSPNLFDHYSAPKGLFVNLVDDYSKLINLPLSKNQGYDEAASAQTSLAAIPTKTHAYHIDNIELKDGHAKVSLDIPNYQGSMRLMLNAANDKSIGSFSQNLIIRDNSVATLALPRFLATQDKSNARINIDNIANESGVYQVTVNCQDSLKCSYTKEHTVTKGERNDFYVPIEAIDNGVGTVNLTVSAQDFKFEDKFLLTVRDKYAPSLVNQSKFVKAKQSVSFDFVNKYKKPYNLNTVLGPLPYVDKKAFISSIDDNYNLSDLPFILIILIDYGHEYFKDNDDKVQNIIDLLVAYQKDSYNFYYSSDSAYFNIEVFKALTYAKDKGYLVNDDALAIALKQTRNSTQNDNVLVQSAAYLALSQYDTINVSALRYLFDSEETTQVLANINMAMTFYNIGDKNRAKEAIQRAISNLNEYKKLSDELYQLNDFYAYMSIYNQITQYSRSMFSSLEHDSYALILAMLHCQDNAKQNQIISLIDELDINSSYLDYNTKATMLQALNLSGTKDSVKNLNLEETAPIVVKNDTDANAYAVVSIYAIPKNPVTEQNGIELERVYYDKNFKELQANSIDVKLNDYVYVVLKGKLNAYSSQNMLIHDYLLAGFEYEQLNENELNKANEFFDYDLSSYSRYFVRTDDKLMATIPMRYDDGFMYIYKLRASVLGSYTNPSVNAYMQSASSINAKYIVDKVFNVKEN